ncbi:10441_t:CDS:2, partial [Ambispora gerdemannii]
MSDKKSAPGSYSEFDSGSENNKSKKVPRSNSTNSSTILSDDEKVDIKEFVDKKHITMQDKDASGNSTGHQNSESKPDDMELNPESEYNCEYEQAPDLCEFIPGLYRLLDLCKDEGSNGL